MPNIHAVRTLQNIKEELPRSISVISKLNDQGIWELESMEIDFWGNQETLENIISVDYAKGFSVLGLESDLERIGYVRTSETTLAMRPEADGLLRQVERLRIFVFGD